MIMKIFTKWKCSKKFRTQLISYFVIYILSNVVIVYVIPFIDIFLKEGAIPNRFNFFEILTYAIKNPDIVKLYFYTEALIILMIISLYFFAEPNYATDQIFITDDIKTPVPSGSGQYGTARWLDKSNFDKVFDYIDFKIDAPMLNYLKEEESEIAKLGDIEIDENALNIGITPNLNNDDRTIYTDEQVAEMLNIKKKSGKSLNNSMLSKHTLQKINNAIGSGVEIEDLNINNLGDEQVNLIIDTVMTLKDKKLYSNYVKKRINNLLTDDSFDINQLNEISYGLLDDVDVTRFADTKYSSQKMRELRLGLKAKLDISIYDDERLSASQMNRIRLSLIDKTSDFVVKDIKNDISYKNEEVVTKPKIKTGGIVLGKEGERIYYVGDDKHSLVLGSTGCGKTRCLVLQTIVLLALANESIFVTDIKGELSDYTAPFLVSRNYEVVTLNFKNPLKGGRYNFLQPVISAVNNNEMSKAIQAVWDITTLLVYKENSKAQEPIWQNGEASIIATAIMAVVYDNKNNPQLQNMANVYYFLSNMCRSVKIGAEYQLPINYYAENLPDEHPAKGLLAIGKIAPSRTRGSFYTSALTTLRLFTDPLIADMTSSTSFNYKKPGTKPMAIYIILPDDKNTYNDIATLFIAQEYQALSEIADMYGGRLKNRVNFICDEFGNFPAIPNFVTMLTVARGKGIRFNLFLQSLAQLKEKYGEANKTIEGNCSTWVYLASEDPDTLKALSEKLGQYTVGAVNSSTSEQKYAASSHSQSVNLVGRALLMADEIGRIKRPYSLIFSSGHKAILISPDISKWQFCRILGMGDRDKDKKVRYYRQSKVKARTEKRLAYFDIHKEIIASMVEKEKTRNSDIFNNNYTKNDEIRELEQKISKMEQVIFSYNMKMRGIGDE